MYLDLRQLHILLAEDNSFMRSLIRTVLQIFGCEDVKEAANGREVLQQ